MCKIFCMLTPLTRNFARYPVSLFNFCTMLYFICTVCKTARLTTTTIFALKYVMCKIFVHAYPFFAAIFSHWVPFPLPGPPGWEKARSWSFFAHQKFSKLPNYLIHLKGECGEIFKPRLFRQPNLPGTRWNRFVFGIYFISMCSFTAELRSLFTMLTPRCAVYRIFSLETKYKTGLACLSWALVGYI